MRRKDETMAREMYLVGVSEEELRPAPKMEPPKTPGGKWDNFWYHYKWPFLGGLFALFVVGILVAQAVTKNPPDYDVVLVTKQYPTATATAALEDSLESCGRDIDGDGEVEVRITNCYMSDTSTNLSLTFYQVLQTRFLSGDFSLFIWEPALYEEFSKNVGDTVSEGYEVFSVLPVQGELLDEGRVWNWAESGKQEGKITLKALPKDLYFTVRNPGGLATDAVEQQAQAMELLTAYVAAGEIKK